MPKRALLVIDVQKEYFTGKIPVTHPAGSLRNILSGMDAAHAGGVPVVVIQHAEPQPDSTVYRKGSHEWGCARRSASVRETSSFTRACRGVLPGPSWNSGCAGAASRLSRWPGT